jgi:tetratricopeptide (TPR) repeat protein
LKNYPTSATALKSFAFACVQTKDWDSIRNAAQQRLDRTPGDGDALEVLSDISERQGQLDKSIALLGAAFKEKRGEPRASLLNNYAWNSLFLTKLPDDAVEAAQRAARITENRDFGIIHTLASLYAEIGRVGEARKLLVQAMDDSGLEQPNSAVWYVFGRINEDYGQIGAARIAYQRVEAPDGETPRPNSTYALTQRALKRIGTSN